MVVKDPASIRIDSERLVLRLARPGEQGAIAHFHQRNREHFAPWDPRRAESFFTEAWWAERIELDHRTSRADRGYRLFLFPRDGPERVGGYVHFSNVVRGAFQSCHLGFAIDRELEGTSRMREALEAALEWSFQTLDLHRVEANHRPENVRSAALLKRLGFIPQGFARDYLFIDGRWCDHVLTALLNPSWVPPRAE